MNRFHFRLQPILELRKQKETEIKNELARHYNDLYQQQTVFQQIHDELAALQKLEKDSRSNALNPMKLRYSVSYRHKLKIDLIRQANTIDATREAIGHVKKELVEAMRQRRAIELLRERQFRQWRKEYTRYEQEILDDVSQQGYIRRQDTNGVVH
jgi:flagellar FliJ protein